MLANAIPAIIASAGRKPKPPTAFERVVGACCPTLVTLIFSHFYSGGEGYRTPPPGQQRLDRKRASTIAAVAFSSLVRSSEEPLAFSVLANLQFGEGLQQGTLSEQGEDGVLRLVNQFFKVALDIGTHEATLRNFCSGRK